MRTAIPLLLLLATLCAEGAVYRWTDAQGGLHFGDRPPPGSAVDRLAGFEQRPLRRRVAKVLDGDTVALSDGVRIRLIGINAPEVAHRDRPGEPYGDEAQALLREMVEGREVVLELDAERHDRYQRLLAHLFDQEGNSINRRMVEAGAAYVVAHPPNLAHLDSYLEAEQAARNQRRGLWALERYGILPAEVAIRHRNTFRRLRTQLLGIKQRGRYRLLQLEGPLELWLENELLGELREQPRYRRLFTGEPFVVRGRIGSRAGVPTIRLYHPSQLERLTAELPPDLPAQR